MLNDVMTALFSVYVVKNWDIANLEASVMCLKNIFGRWLRE